MKSISQPNPRNQALSDGLAIFDLFKRARSSLSIDEISSELGLDSLITEHLCSTLLSIGYLSGDTITQNYSPTAKLLTLAGAYYAANPLLETALPFISELSRKIDESISLLAYNNLEIIHVITIDGGGSGNLSNLPGSGQNIIYSASGRAILAHFPAMDVVGLIFSAERRRMTKKTLTDPKDIVAEIEKAALKEYALLDEEINLDQISIGSALLDKQNRPIGAIEVTAPRSNWKWLKAREKLGTAVSVTASQITKEFKLISLP